MTGPIGVSHGLNR